MAFSGSIPRAIGNCCPQSRLFLPVLPSEENRAIVSPAAVSLFFGIESSVSLTLSNFFPDKLTLELLSAVQFVRATEPKRDHYDEGSGASSTVEKEARGRPETTTESKCEHERDGMTNI